MNSKILKNSLIAIVVALSVALGWQWYLNKELSKEISAKDASELIQLQDKCSQQALKVANSENYRVAPSRDFYTYHSHSSHYNHKLKKCFALIKTESSDSQGYLSHGEHLIDAFENRDYGSYLWTKKQAKGATFYDTNPYVCKVTPSLNEEKRCNSLSEFNSLISQYLE